MQRLTVRQEIFTFIGVAGVVLALVLGFIVYPAVLHIIELQKTIKQTHTFLENKYQSIQNAKKSVSALPEVEKNIALFSEAILRSGNELQFITNLEALADTHGIDQELSAVLIDDPAKMTKQRRQKGRAYYQFSFLNKGNYQNHIAYLKELERAPFYLLIDKMVFEKDTKNTAEKDSIIVRFDGYIYAAHE